MRVGKARSRSIRFALSIELHISSESCELQIGFTFALNMFHLSPVFFLKLLLNININIKL